MFYTPYDLQPTRAHQGFLLKQVPSLYLPPEPKVRICISYVTQTRAAVKCHHSGTSAGIPGKGTPDKEQDGR